MQGNLTRRRLVQLLALAGGTVVLPAKALPEEPVESFIAALADELLAIIIKDAPRAQKKEQFQALLVERADIPAIARFSLGRFVRKLPERDRKNYYALVAAYISSIFATHAIGLAGEAVTVTGSTRRSERETVVSSKVKFASGRSLTVDWRVRETDGVYKVFDVSINGIWLAIQQRSEFISVIKRGGGTIDALLEHLRKHSG